MYQGNHAETRRAHAVLALVVAEASVKYKEWLVPVEYTTQVPYHLFLR